MSKKRVLLAVNTLTAVGSQPYASHLNFAFRARDTGDEFYLFNGYRNSIDRFRNAAGQIAVSNEFDYLMFLDDDVLIAPQTYAMLKERMEAHENWVRLLDGINEDAWPQEPKLVDVVTPVVYIRSYPFHPMFFKSTDLGDSTGLDIYKDWKEKCQLGELLPVAAVGFSCCLIRVELLKKIQPAWFVTGTHHTEDVYFCVKAKQTLALRGETVGIYVDTRLDSGHMLDSEFVCTPSVEALRHFYEEMNPALKLKDTGGDNSSVYLSDQKAALGKAEVVSL
jgi:hypothetical protein